MIQRKIANFDDGDCGEDVEGMRRGRRESMKRRESVVTGGEKLYILSVLTLKTTAMRALPPAQSFDCSKRIDI